MYESIHYFIELYNVVCQICVEVFIFEKATKMWLHSTVPLGDYHAIKLPQHRIIYHAQTIVVSAVLIPVFQDWKALVRLY